MGYTSDGKVIVNDPYGERFWQDATGYHKERVNGVGAQYTKTADRKGYQLVYSLDELKALGTHYTVILR